MNADFGTHSTFRDLSSASEQPHLAIDPDFEAIVTGERRNTKPQEQRDSQAWQNSRLRFNPQARHATKAQRTELLRRDGWGCRTPGCPNKVWLHLHHLNEYSQGGETAPSNLICLCSGCHRNVHQGVLKITESPEGELLYTNSEGRRLDQQIDLELADWLDLHLGWSGVELDSHQAKLWQGEWACSRVEVTNYREL